MSSIPNSAMPHAAPAAGNEEAEAGQGFVSRAAGLVRDNPKKAIAAGAAVAAGVATAAVVRARRGAASTTDSGGKKGGSSGSAKGGKKGS